MREFFTIAIFKIKADIRMNKPPLNRQKEKHSMLSLRRATHSRAGRPCRATHFYPRSPCGERLAGDALADLRKWISIHALLAESDVTHVLHFPPTDGFLSTLSLRRATRRAHVAAEARSHFYPRSPCGERPTHVTISTCGMAFLSTLSLRRATPKIIIQSHGTIHFYPRSPCGERLLYISRLTTAQNFYPRSPCGERPWL